MKTAPSATWTILSLLKWTTEYFQAQGVSEPRASAEVLLAHALGMERMALYLQYDKPLTAEELGRFKTLLRQRLAGEPTQYIIGHQEFWSLDFLVNPAALIPRPETEVLVEAILDQVQQLDLPQNGRYLLDLGTGSGVLAVVLARELPEAQLVALDLSTAALQLARANARRHQVADRIWFVQGDLFQPLRVRPIFGVIASNPPYVPTSEWARLPREIRNFEPQAALDGGPDGLEIMRRIISEAYHYLVPGGLLALEIGHNQAERVLELFAAQPAYLTREIRPDYQGVPRVVVAQTVGMVGYSG